jgi:hypothetical protein
MKDCSDKKINKYEVLINMAVFDEIIEVSSL